MPIQRTDVIYSDFTRNLDAHPVSGDLIRYTNQESVRQSVRNLLLTNRGSRPYNSDTGTNLRKLLQEPISPVTEQMISEQIRETILAFEPRVELQYVNVTINNDQAAYTATIVFSMVNILEPVTLTIILQRIR